jgi:FkbM family methyltransferase
MLVRPCAMRLGGRAAGTVLRAPLHADHYRALLGMLRRYPDRRDGLRRYLGKGGSYPCRFRVRTPLGIVAPMLYSSHDMRTLNEVFCRGDYRVRQRVRVAVDVGSNIGISALYFLTRDPACRVYLFEPDPRNVQRLRENLAGFESRYTVEEVAVGVEDARAIFGTEPTGRYGTLRLDIPTRHPATELIEVDVRSLNRILRGALEREERVDVLKIDTEGSEADLVTSIEPALLDRIEVIVYETDEPMPLHRSRYRHHYSCQINRLSAIRP